MGKTQYGEIFTNFPIIHDLGIKLSKFVKFGLKTFWKILNMIFYPYLKANNTNKDYYVGQQI